MPTVRVLVTDYAWPDLDLERAELASLSAELVVAPDTRETTLARLAAECDAILFNWAPLTAAVLAAAPRCKIAVRFGIGVDNIDLAAATAAGITVANVPDYCLIEVAEHTLALLLALARNVAFFHHAARQGQYQLQAGPPLRRLAGQTLGIVGLGHIGREVARRAACLGLRLLGTDRQPVDVPGLEYVSLDRLLAESDYITLHVPLLPATRHMIGAEQFARMKPGAGLINTARGGLIDHAALAAALTAGRLRGAALDVQEPEPPDLSQPPFSDPRVIVTPHAAFCSLESVRDMRTRAARAVVARLSGRAPDHVLNPQTLSGLAGR